MTAETEFILQCNQNSFIEQVLYAREKLDAATLLEQPLLFCLVPESLETGKKFLDSIRWNGKAENFEMEILLDQKKYRFVFSGVQLRQHIIIVAQHAKPVTEPELPVEAIISEEVNQSLNETAAEPEAMQESEVTVWDLLEEMSRLNNELINTKRELVRKNMELERLQQELKKR